MNENLLELIKPPGIPYNFQQQKAKSISATLHTYKKPARKYLNVIFTFSQIFRLFALVFWDTVQFFRPTTCHLTSTQVIELYRKGEIGPPYMKIVFSNLETYYDFAYV